MRALRQDEVVRGEVPAEVGSALRSVVRFSGRVIHGFGRGGKQLGFPTANLPVDDDAAPDLPVGIYYGVARVPEVSGDAIFGMAMSVGWNPYFQNERKALEVHVLHDFGADFYGATLHAAVLGFVRPEHNFASLDDLKQAIADDVSYARARLSDPDGRPLELVYGAWMSSWWDLNWVFFAGLPVYGVLGAVAATLFMVTLCCLPRQLCAVSVLRVFHLELAVFGVARMGWSAANSYTWNVDSPDYDWVYYAGVVCGRVAFTAYLSAFLLVLLWSVELLRTNTITKVDDFAEGRFLPSLRLPYAVACVLLCASQLLLLLLWALLSDGETGGNPYYEAMMMIDASMSLAVSVAFLVYGALQCTLRRFSPRKSIEQLLIAAVLFICFLLRFCMYVSRWIFNLQSELPDTVFYSLAFYIPEVVAVLGQMLLVHIQLLEGRAQRAVLKEIYDGAAVSSSDGEFPSSDVARQVRDLSRHIGELDSSDLEPMSAADRHVAAWNVGSYGSGGVMVGSDMLTQANE